MGLRLVRPELVVYLKESGTFFPRPGLPEEAACCFRLQLQVLGLSLPEVELVNPELKSERKELR